MKTDSVYKHALSISVVILILGVIEFLIFTAFLSFKFKPDVLFGTIYGCLFSCLNFFYLAYCVKSSTKRSEKQAQAYMGATYSSRILLTGLMIFIAAKVDFLNIWAAIIPLVFTRIAVYIVTFKGKRGDKI